MQQTATPKKAPKKFFYGWIIVLCCTLLMAVGTGIFVNCVGILVFITETEQTVSKLVCKSF